MSFVLDAILIAICIAIIATSVKRGFAKTVLSAVSLIAAVLLAVVFTPTLSSLLYEGFVLKSITSGILGTVGSLAGTGDSAGVLNMLETMPDVLSDILLRYNVSDETVSSMAESAKGGEATVESICETIASPVASMLSNVLAFVICFVAAVLVLKIAVFIINAVFKLPLLKTVNRAAGLVLGILLAAVAAYVYASVAVELMNGLGALSPKMFGDDVVSGTIIIKFISENNTLGLISNVLRSELNL